MIEGGALSDRPGALALIGSEICKARESRASQSRNPWSASGSPGGDSEEHQRNTPSNQARNLGITAPSTQFEKVLQILKFYPPWASIVRKGSPVRVRQRAPKEALLRRGFSLPWGCTVPAA